MLLKSRPAQNTEIPGNTPLLEPLYHFRALPVSVSIPVSAYTYVSLFQTRQLLVLYLSLVLVYVSVALFPLRYSFSTCLSLCNLKPMSTFVLSLSLFFLSPSLSLIACFFSQSVPQFLSLALLYSCQYLCSCPRPSTNIYYSFFTVGSFSDFVTIHKHIRVYIYDKQK